MKEKNIELTLKKIEKKFGKGSLIRLNSNKIIKTNFIPTGSISLDYALGIGGLPTGRIIEIYGPESSGKTTLTLEIISSAQKRGKTCVFIDAEHALDISYAKNIGVNINKLLCSQPDNGEQALEICNTLAKYKGADVIVIDSVAALTPKAEIEGKIGDTHLGLTARMMSQAMRKLAKNISNSNILLIFINQIRIKIGVIFGNPETTTGGNALKFYSSIRMEVRKINNIKDKEEIIGNKIKIKIVKNKVSSPFKQVKLYIIYKIGLDKYREILHLSIKNNIIQKNGAWYSFDKKKIGHGKNKALYFLQNNINIYKNIKKQIKKILYKK